MIEAPTMTLREWEEARCRELKRRQDRAGRRRRRAAMRRSEEYQQRQREAEARRQARMVVCCNETGKELRRFSGMRDAGEAIGRSRSAIHNAIHRRRPSGYWYWRFAGDTDWKPAICPRDEHRKSNSRAVIVRGRRYPSIQAAALATGATWMQVCRACQRGRAWNGWSFRFEE